MQEFAFALPLITKRPSNKPGYLLLPLFYQDNTGQVKEIYDFIEANKSSSTNCQKIAQLKNIFPSPVDNCREKGARVKCKLAKEAIKTGLSDTSTGTKDATVFAPNKSSFKLALDL